MKYSRFWETPTQRPGSIYTACRIGQSISLSTSRATHDFGETIAALREKIREVELFVRDKYIEKNDFIVQMQHHNEMITMNFSAITARLDRMEKKLDQKT